MHIGYKVKALLIAMLLLGIYVYAQNSETSNRHSIYVFDVEKREISSRILASGEVIFEKMVELRPEVTGVIADVFVDEGDFVERGDVLMRFDQRTLEAELKQQMANVEARRAELERAVALHARAQRQLAKDRSLFESNLISTDAYDEAETRSELANHDVTVAEHALAMSEARKTSIEENLDKTTIRAPFRSRVINLSLKEGETAVASITNFAGSQLLTLADMDSVIANIYIDETDLSQVAVSQQVELTVMAYPDSPLLGTIREINLAPEPRESGEGLKYKALVDIENLNDLALRSSMSLRAQVIVDSEGESLVVPHSAVYGSSSSSDANQGQGGYYTFVVTDGTLAKRMIELGESNDDVQAVSEGLNLGELVVSGPYAVMRRLEHGDRVSIIEKH